MAPGAGPATLAPGASCTWSALCRAAGIRRPPVFFPDPTGDELGEQLPEPMHARWKVLGLRKVDVVSLSVTIVIGLGIGPL